MSNINLVPVLALAIFMTACGSSLPAAGPSSTMMEQADAILIQTPDSPRKAYQKIRSIVLNKGFGLFKQDERTRTLITSPYDLGMASGETQSGSPEKAQFNIKVREDQQTVILLKGRYGFENPNSDYNFDNQRIAGGGYTISNAGEIANHPDPDSFSSQGWSLMMEVAKSYQNGRLFYARNR